MTATKRKLIEVALPLEAINRESAREKSIRYGHPSTLHLWWARRPLAACRAVLFASLVDDPSARPDEFPTDEDQDVERKRLFRIIEELVEWESSSDKEVLAAARAEILQSCDGDPPSVLDPFCGGGSIPLEAERLGLEAHGSDLNPVAVLITKALIEVPPKFAAMSPVHPQDGPAKGLGAWEGAQGIAEDVRYYGEWMRDEAERRIGQLYPKAKIPPEQGGGSATVIAWLWARTVTCPNPACGACMPLVRSFALSTRKGQEAWIAPVVDDKQVNFIVRTGNGSIPSGTVDRRGARCLVCGHPVPLSYLREQGKTGNMGTQLMAMVVNANRRRMYLRPDPEHEQIARQARPRDVPDTDLPAQGLGFRVQGYGMTKHRDLFTDRQLVALTTVSELTGEAEKLVREAAVAAGFADDRCGLSENGAGATAYAEAVRTYLALGVSRLADISNALCRWENTRTQVRNLFTRQAVPMVWDFAETNLFGNAAGDYAVSLESVARVLERSLIGAHGDVEQLDATSAVSVPGRVVVATDPPYYDNVGYADLSDFFYIWLRRCLSRVFPAIFSTVLTPKTQELIADPARFNGNAREAERFFENGLGEAFERMRSTHDSRYPLTVIYAFKQAESDSEDAVVSTGWETMLEALLRTGFTITGTWPLRSELANRMRGQASNALASSIALVCRPASSEARLTTRREFTTALRAELPRAVRILQHGNIAPVDLAQAAIGPGMAVFSRYARVVEADGSPMGVRTALTLINQVIDELLAEQEGECDADTRWAIAWFEQYGMNEGPFGVAETLSKAKNTAIKGMVDAGIVVSRAGKVRLIDRDEFEAIWDPSTDSRLTVWEIAQHLIGTLERDGESGAANLLRRVGGLGEAAHDLAYRLYKICERKKWPKEALAYNALVVAWPEITRLALETSEPVQQRLGE